MDTLKKIWEFIKKFSPFIFFITTVLLMVFLFQTCNTLKNERAQREYENKLNEQNFKAKTNDITVGFNKKLKAWEFEKASYILKLEDLEKYDKGLSDTIKKLKGKIAILISTNSTIDIGKTTIGNDLIKLNEEHYGLNFTSRYSDPGLFQVISGQSRFYAIQEKIVEGNNTTVNWHIKSDSTIIDTNYMKIKIIYGLRESDKYYNVFASTSSPKVIFTDLTGGYFIDKQPPLPSQKPKRWGIGPYVGAGLNLDLNGANPRFGWSVGVSINYDIWQW